MGVEVVDRLHALPPAVGVELPGEHVVGEAHVEDLLQSGLQRRRLDRCQGLDPPIEVSLHEVSRPDEVHRLAGRRAVGEVVDA